MLHSHTPIRVDNTSMADPNLESTKFNAYAQSQSNPNFLLLTSIQCAQVFATNLHITWEHLLIHDWYLYYSFIDQQCCKIKSINS